MRISAKRKLFMKGPLSGDISRLRFLRKMPWVASGIPAAIEFCDSRFAPAASLSSLSLPAKTGEGRAFSAFLNVPRTPALFATLRLHAFWRFNDVQAA